MNDRVNIRTEERFVAATIFLRAEGGEFYISPCPIMRDSAATRLAINPLGKIPAGLKGLIELPRAIVAKTA